MCALGLVLTTSASTVSSAYSTFALLLIGLVVITFISSYLPPLIISYLIPYLIVPFSIYSQDDGRTRDSKS